MTAQGQAQYDNSVSATLANPAQPNHFLLPKQLRKLFAFGAIILAIYCGDGIMSYLAPILIEQRFESALQMGLVMSTSSMWGLLFDALAGRFFAQRQFAFFVKWVLLFALAFPMFLLLFPQHSIALFAAMAVWGMYYELTKFALFNFVKATMQHTQHTVSWAFFEVLHALGFVIGPVVASMLLEKSAEFSLSAAMGCFLFAVVSFKLYLLIYPTRHGVVNSDSAASAKQTPTQPKILITWELLSAKLWPLLLFVFALVLIDTAFLSVGTLLSEELKTQNYIGLLLLPAYSAPFLIMPWFAKPLSVRLGKKRTAYIAGILGGLLLAVGSLATQVEVLLAAVFTASLCLALAYPEMNATFEDYVVRVGKLGNSVIGLQSAMYSLAYIIGPPLAGLVATEWGNHYTLTVFGGLLSVVGVLALVVTPRKVRMPQTELKLT